MQPGSSLGAWTSRSSPIASCDLVRPAMASIAAVRRARNRSWYLCFGFLNENDVSLKGRSPETDVAREREKLGNPAFLAVRESGPGPQRNSNLPSLPKYDDSVTRNSTSRDRL